MQQCYFKRRQGCRFKNNLEEIAASEIDGIILSDIGLIEDVVDNGLEAHISVQENTSNSFMLKTLKKLGAKRAILSRELSLEDIKKQLKNLRLKQKCSYMVQCVWQYPADVFKFRFVWPQCELWRLFAAMP